jgi:hypothetical protein
MREIDLAANDLGADDPGVITLAVTRSQRELYERHGIRPDELAGLSPFEAKMLLDTLDEVAAMSPGELDALVDGATADVAGGNPAGDDGAALAAYLESLEDTEFANVMADAAAYGGDGLDYLEFSRTLDEDYRGRAGREATRQAEDAKRPARLTEDRLATALRRLEARTYVPDTPPAEFAGDPDFGDLTYAGRAATPAEVTAELRYQLTGQGVPAGRMHREPLPPVAGLAVRLGLRP